MADHSMIDIVLEKIKKIIDIEKFDDAKILIDTNDKLPDDITLKNIAIIITCVIKDDDKFHLLVFSEKHFLLNTYVQPFFIDEK